MVQIMKKPEGIVSRLIKRNKLILILSLVTAAGQVYVFGFGTRVLINVVFQLIVSYFLSYALTFLKLKSYDEDLHMKSWNVTFAFIAIMSLIAFLVFPEFEGFK